MANVDGVARDEVVRTGTRFGPEDDLIELGDELGSGAAARVYVCRRLRTGEELAAKVVNLQRLRLLGDFESQIAKLDREVKILRDLAHPRIVRLHDVVRTRGWVFLVLELVRGGELFDRIVQNKCLNEVEARHIFRQLLEGVGYMHSRGVIHRDLKPENILISCSRPADPPDVGQLHDVKIADFGLSKIISNETSWAKTFVGTPQYWAPEVLAVQDGSGGYTQACDFWSLGAVLFVMLCGRYPFDGKKMPLQEQIRTATYNTNTAAWQKVSEEAKSMVRGLLSVSPVERLTLGGCLNHPWLVGRGMQIPQRPSSPGLGRTVSMATPTVGSLGPKVSEVSAGNVASGAVPLVSQPSQVSDASSVENVGSPSDRADPVASRTNVTPIRVEPLQSVEERPGALPHEAIFCLNELLKLQVSIAGSLEVAALAFRHADIELAEAIQNTFWQSKELASASFEVVSKFAQVAQQVSSDVLPDLDLAVQEKEPTLATNLLGMVKEWVVEMKCQGEKVKCRYHGLQESVQSLIQRAQKSKMGSDRRLAEAMESLLSPSQPTSQRPALEDGRLEPAESGESGGAGVAAAAPGASAAPPPTSRAPPSPPLGAVPGAVSFAPRVPSAPTVEAAPSGGAAVGLPMTANHWTRQLFEHLRCLQAQPNKAIQDQVELNAGSGAGVGATASAALPKPVEMDTEAWKQEMLELLFMTPGVLPTPSASSAVPPPLPKVESYDGEAPPRRQPPVPGDAGDVQMAGATPSASSTARPSGFPSDAEEVPAAGDAAEEEEAAAVVAILPRLSPQSAAEAMGHSSASLLRALHELKRVDEILEGCSSFWANMDVTVQKLSQMKEHTECLLNYASKSKPLKERFDKRLAEYTDFWNSLEKLCRQYCVDHQAKTKRMYEVIREVSDCADIIETANSARLGYQLSVMREKQRRQGGF